MDNSRVSYWNTVVLVWALLSQRSFVLFFLKLKDKKMPMNLHRSKLSIWISGTLPGAANCSLSRMELPALRP